MGRPSGSQVVKVGRPSWSHGRKGGLRCPIGSTATFDGASDSLYGSQGGLKGPMRLGVDSVTASLFVFFISDLTNRQAGTIVRRAGLSSLES